MIAINKVIWATILVTKVSKADREVNPEHAVETRETRINRAVLAGAASKGSREVSQIVKDSKGSKGSKEASQIVKDSKDRRAEFLQIGVVLH
ncbi:MAG: hypothetical protein E6H10_00685 [Bacteroidetes bacterium]|nr:MAG: hypothetical protein E6H10_00685 [Bacteroidota bacterium]